MNKTKIEWMLEKYTGRPGYTWNPVTGCSFASEGCQNCYAKAMAKRFSKTFNNFEITFHEDRLEEPSKLRNPSNIFVCSMSDLFHEDVKEEWVDKITNVLNNEPQHNYIILTKRPENITTDILYSKNIWWGVSVENATSKKRIEILNRYKIKNTFISFEPLINDTGHDLGLILKEYNIKWVIVGGETGRHARPIQKEWVDEIYAHCQMSNIPFFFKKGIPEYEQDEYRQVPEGLKNQQFQRKNQFKHDYLAESSDMPFQEIY